MPESENIETSYFEKVEVLKFLISQAEERIKTVDNKASILLAFYGILISSKKTLEELVYDYDVPDFIIYPMLLSFLISSVCLVLVIKPVKNFKAIIFAGKSDKENRGFWIIDTKPFEENKEDKDNKDLDLTSWNKFTSRQFGEDLYEIYIKVTKQRIKKYQLFRYSMLALRIAFMIFIFSIIFSMIT